MTTHNTQRISELEQRVRKIEEEVDEVEPPKSPEMQKIERLEEKIDKVIQASMAGATGQEPTHKQDKDEEDEPRVSEEYQGMPGHEIVDKVREENLLDPEDIETSRDTDNIEVDVGEDLSINHEEATRDEKRQAVYKATKHIGEPATVREIATTAFNVSDVEAKDSEYTSTYNVLREAPDSIQKLQGGTGGRNKYEYIGPQTTETKDEENREEEEGMTEEEEARMIKEDLKDNERKVVNNLSNSLRRPSKEVAKTSEELNPNKVRAAYKKLKEHDLITTTVGSGAKLTPLGQTVKEVETEDNNYTEEDIIDADKYSMKERNKKILEHVENFYKPPTAKELAQKIYRLPDSHLDKKNCKHYTRVLTSINQLKNKGLLQKSRERPTNGRSEAWELTDEAIHDAGDGKVSHQFDYEEAKNDANVSDSDMEIVEQTFSKLINERGEEKIGYFDFEGRYSGNTTPIRMFQKLFSNPDLLEGVRREVCPDKEFSWTKRESGKYDAGEKNWLLKVSE